MSIKDNLKYFLATLFVKESFEIWTQSGNRWRRTQSKSMPRSRPRSASASRGSTTEYRTIKEFQDTVLKELKILKEKQDKLAKVQDEMVTKVLWAVDSFIYLFRELF